MADPEIVVVDGTAFTMMPPSFLPLRRSVSDMSPRTTSSEHDSESFLTPSSPEMGLNATSDPEDNPTPLAEQILASPEPEVDQTQSFAPGTQITASPAVPVGSKTVFVGGLPAYLSNSFLKTTIEGLFAEYSPREVVVCSGDVGPIAFVEFATNEVAIAAQRKAFGMIVHGMSIRSEIAVPRTAAFVRRLDNLSIHKLELSDMEAKFEIRSSWQPNDTKNAVFNLGNGYFIDFMSHSEYKKAMKFFAMDYDFSRTYKFNTLHDLGHHSPSSRANCKPRLEYNRQSHGSAMKPFVAPMVQNYPPIAGVHVGSNVRVVLDSATRKEATGELIRPAWVQQVSKSHVFHLFDMVIIKSNGDYVRGFLQGFF